MASGTAMEMVMRCLHHHMKSKIPILNLEPTIGTPRTVRADRAALGAAATAIAALLGSQVRLKSSAICSPCRRRSTRIARPVTITCSTTAIPATTPTETLSASQPLRSLSLQHRYAALATHCWIKGSHSSITAMDGIRTSLIRTACSTPTATSAIRFSTRGGS